MRVRDGMTQLVLTVGPAHTLRDAARLMSGRRVGAAIVTDSEHAGIGILTERDILDSVGAGQDPDSELVANHRTGDLVFALPDWTLEQAAASRIGGATARAIAAAGARPLIAGRDEGRLAAIAAETGGTALAVDLAAPGGAAELADAAVRTAPDGIDVLVNNAGIGW